MSKKEIYLNNRDCNLCVTIAENISSDSVIVALHGGPGSGAQPIMDLPAFQTLEKSFSIVYFDQRGSGKSDFDYHNKISSEDIASDVNAVVEYAKLRFPGKRISLWGGSFGGLVGLIYLSCYPSNVDKAILSSPAVYIMHPDSPMANNASAIVEQFAPLLPPDIDEKVKSIIAEGGTMEDIFKATEFVDWIETAKPPMGNASLWQTYAMRDWLSTCDMRESIKDIKIPTLFFMGMQDPVLPAQVLIDAIAQCKNDNVSLKTFSPCGHGVFDDCCDEFCRLCTEAYMQ